MGRNKIFNSNKKSKFGRPEMCPRKASNAILYVLKTGIQWRYFNFFMLLRKIDKKLKEQEALKVDHYKNLISKGTIPRGLPRSPIKKME